MPGEYDIANREHRKFNDYSGAKNVVVLDEDGNPVKQEIYATNAIDEASGTLTYIGKEDNNGAWQIQKIDTSSGTVFTYATVKNNPMVTSYTDAWSNRGTLTYGRYGEVL